MSDSKASARKRPPTADRPDGRAQSRLVSQEAA